MKTSANAASLLLTGSARNALLFLIAFGLFSGAPLLPGVETETARTSGETKSHAKLPVPNVSHAEQKPSDSHSGEKKGEESEALVHLTEVQRNLIRLRLSRATPGRIDNTIRLNGEIRLNRNETAKVMPRMPGFVSGIHVREGDIVRKGDRLATLTSHKLGEYYAAYNSALEQEKLANSEFEMAENGEIIITSNNKKDVCNKLKESSIYQELLSENEDRLMLFHSRGFTSQIPEKEFRRILDKINLDTTSDEKFIKYNTKRLQEGVAVIDPQKSLQLLADDSRSIMSHLYGTETYILREYRVD